MIASVLSQQKRIYKLVLLRVLPQMLWFPQKQFHTGSCFYALWKMIGMRRGLWGKVSRQNQSISRETDFGLPILSPWPSPLQLHFVTTSASRIQIYDQMPAAEETTPSSPVPKRAKLDADMPASSSAVLRFARLSEHATPPMRGSELAAGYDLYSAQDCVIPAQGKETVMTDIQIEVPEGCYGRVAPRSGLARKNHIDVGAGVIDRDYRGNVGVVLFNHSKEEFKVEKGHRIAQLICERIIYPELEEVKKLSETERGSAGYGSTGTN